MRILKYTNSRGESLTFKNGSSFIITKINGLGDVEADIQTQRSPYQDGDTPIDTLLEPRYIDFEVFFRGTDDTDVSEKRSQLSRVFNPKLGEGKFELQYGDIKREIFAISEHVPNYPLDVKSNGVMNQKAQINLKCPNPYWQSPNITEEPMAAFVELFEFPSDYWEVGEDGDLYFEMGIEGHTRTFMNNGDAPVPLKIKIKGSTLNPTLTNLTTGEFIKINRELKANDELEISTESGNKYVLLNSDDVFNWIALGSTFWELQVGRNEVQYTADAGQESATLTIEWQEQFVGV